MFTTEYAKITPYELRQSDVEIVYIKIKNNYFMAIHDRGKIKLNAKSSYISVESIVNSGYEIYICARNNKLINI